MNNSILDAYLDAYLAYDIEAVNNLYKNIKEEKENSNMKHATTIDTYICVGDKKYNIDSMTSRITSRNEHQEINACARLSPYNEFNPYEPEKVIFNDPATIVFWKDGTKTVVKAVYEPFDKEKGLAMAIAKKALGNKGKYFNVFKKFISESDKVEKERKCSKCKTVPPSIDYHDKLNDALQQAYHEAIKNVESFGEALNEISRTWSDYDFRC